MRTILSIAFTAAIILMPEVDFRSAREVRDMIIVRDPGRQQALHITPRMPDDSTDNIYRDLRHAKMVFEFYQRRRGAVCWITNNGLSASGDSLITIINNIRYFGLLPQDYHINELEENSEAGNSSILRTEALLTDGLLLIANDLRYGRSAQPDAKAEANSLHALERIVAGIGIIPTLESLEPSLQGYTLLKAALKASLDTLTGAAREEWMTGRTYRSNPLHQTMQTLEINMERWRSANGPISGVHVTVNIPSFTLEANVGDETILSSRVIVGGPETPTPLLRSDIECIVVYPYWVVPRKIVVEEYLPLIQRDSSYLARHHFEILDRRGNIINPDSINWTSLNENNFPFTMRQSEGPDNALGLVKFVFDNPYAVYLHDTNVKGLFKSNYRAYSHGCIRLEKAEALAHFLITMDVDGRSEMLETALQQQRRLSIDLSQEVPIEVTYFTCEVKGGKFYRYNDVYSLDNQLASLLY
jgi:murein L,D-transpeptidase YcbB/YkuD